jgi:hypothetical protein
MVGTLGEIAAEYLELRPQFLICGFPSKLEASLGLLT